MNGLFLLVLLIVFPVSELPAEQGTWAEELMEVAVHLRLDQLRLKDVSLQITEMLLGSQGALNPEESRSLERVNQRLVTVGMMVSYEASRLEMLSFLEPAHRIRFVRRLTEELDVTIRALSVDEESVRDHIENWPEVLRERLGVPANILSGARLDLEDALRELRRLGAEAI